MFSQKTYLCNKNMHFESTICAPACPPGGALSIIRVSGPDTFRIVEGIVSVPGEKSALSKLNANTVHFGIIKDEGKVLDEVLISLFRAPHSYSGEDIIEITCHGSPYIQKRILEILMSEGCTLAMPGEFTQRAFLNGKLDLSEAEAVADLIASESQTAHRIAINQMRGALSKEFKVLRKKLLDFTSLIELELDFSDEDVEFAGRDELKALVNDILSRSRQLRDSFTLGNALKNGVPVAIIGKPNVGKSTLLNSLLQDEKAIVSEIAGTTRDSIEDTIIIDGILFRFIDTAGIRETADIIENLGIRRTYQKIETASIILLVIDARDSISDISEIINEIRKQISGEDKQLFVLLNKSDLCERKKLLETIEAISLENNEQILPYSAVSGENHAELIDRLKFSITRGHMTEDRTIISNLRHLEALNGTIENLQRVLEGLENKLPEDLLAQDLRQALYKLGSITGEVTTEEVLGNIFRNFCIGK
jgi:tRNA modification GTPase